MSEPHPSVAAPIDGRDFDELSKAIKSVKLAISRPIRGLGKRASIPIIFEFSGKIFELFCEASVLECKPEDPAIGFTNEDVYFFEGVVVFNKEKEDVAGEVLAFENFLAKYVSEPMTRVFLSRKMDELKAAAALDEEAIQNVNSMYMNRDVGEKIVDFKVH